MVFIIKKVCELSKEELNIKEREFRKTAFGHRLYDFKVTMIIEEVFFFIFMFIFKSDTYMPFSALQDGVFWLGILIAAGLGSLIQMKYIDNLKEYIETTKQKND